MDDKNEHLDIGEGVLIEKVDKFCYLGDMLNADGGCDSAVMARVRYAWKNFREYTYLYGKGIIVKIEGKVYTGCVRSCLIYSSETWPMKVKHEAKLDRNEMSMLIWMCGFNLKDNKKTTEIRGLLGLDN